MSDRNLLLKQLEDKSSLLQSIIENSSNIIFSLDTNLKYVLFNSAHKNEMKMIYGADIEIGMGLLDILSEFKNISFEKDNLENAIKGISTKYEMVYGDVVKYWYEVSILPNYNQAHEIIGVNVFVENISDRKLFLEQRLKIKELEKQMKLESQRIKTSSLVQGQEEERERISKEIHDGLGQILSVIKFNVDLLDIHTSEYFEKKNQIKKLIDQGVYEIRNIANNLMPSVLKDFGLIPAIEILCKEGVNNVFFSYDVHQKFLKLKPNTEIHIYRIVQEALSNAVKYSNFKKIDVIISKVSSNKFQFLIKDDGVGFLNKEKKYKGNGLFNMKQRAYLMGAQLKIQSKLNEGTIVSLLISV